MQQNTAAVNATVAALTNVSLANAAMQRAMNAPSHLPNMIGFTGKPGYGKTSAATYLVTKYNAVHIEAKSTTTPKSLLLEIIKELGLFPARTVDEMRQQVCEELGRSRRPLIVDEFDYLVKKKQVEIVRDIYEGSRSPIMIIGEQFLPGKLAQWERFHSRILEWRSALPADMDDARTLNAFYCKQVAIQYDLLSYIHGRADGSVRRIVVNLDMMQEAALSVGKEVFALADWQEYSRAEGLDLYTGEAPTGDR